MQHLRLLTLCWCSVDALLTLCWCSVDALLMLCWRSVDAHCQVKWHQDWRFCLERQPILQLWANSVAHPLDYTRCNTQIRWRSVDAHFQTGAVTMMLFLLHIKAADTSIMGKCHSIALGLYKMQHPRLLTLCWRSVDALLMLCWRCVDALLTLICRWSDIDIKGIAYKGGQNFDYGSKPQHSPWIIQDATPEIVDALLTLIFTMGLWPCCCPFWA